MEKLLEYIEFLKEADYGKTKVDITSVVAALEAIAKAPEAGEVKEDVEIMKVNQNNGGTWCESCQKYV